MEIEVIFCDDVRFEVTGKQSLIGVYTSDLRTNIPDVDIPVWIWMRIKGIPKGSHEFSVTLTSPNNASTSKASGEMEITREGYPVPLALGPLPVKINTDGLLEAKIEINSELVHVAQIHVGVGNGRQPE